MKFNIAVGTHHKTGTHWMRNVFRQIAQQLDVPFVAISRKQTDDAEQLVQRLLQAGSRFIVFHDHSMFPPSVRSATFRGVRMVRDPRDVLISAVRYHLTTDAQWVNQPRGRFGGKTLKAALSALPDMESRLLFEIEHVIGQALERMESFDRGSVFADIRYEDLVTDRGFAFTLSMLEHLGLEGETELLVGCIAMWQNSLFGALAREGNAHINDGSERQHESVMSSRVRKAFEDRFGDVAQRLGYDGRDTGHALKAAQHDVASPSIRDFVTTLARSPGQGGGLAAALRMALDRQVEPGPLLAIGAEVAAETGDMTAAIERASAALRWSGLPEAQMGTAVNVLVRAGRPDAAMDLLQARHAAGDRRETLYVRLTALLVRAKSRLAEAQALCDEGLAIFPQAVRLRTMRDRLPS